MLGVQRLQFSQMKQFAPKPSCINVIYKNCIYISWNVNNNILFLEGNFSFPPLRTLLTYYRQNIKIDPNLCNSGSKKRSKPLPMVSPPGFEFTTKHQIIGGQCFHFYIIQICGQISSNINWKASIYLHLNFLPNCCQN